MKSAVYLKFLKRLKEIREFEWNEWNNCSVKIWGHNIHEGETVLEAIARNMIEVLEKEENA